MNEQPNSIETVALAARLRRQALEMVHRSGASHIGSCLSIADLLAVLYGDYLQVSGDDPNWADRDRFILSKGHAAAIFYAALAERGFFPQEWLHRYCTDGSELAGHVTGHVPGVEVSAGALGHGLPIGIGFALAARRDGRDSRTVVILSDGECDEGSVWEAALLAPQIGLPNLTAIVDYNRIQSFGRVSEVAELEPLAAKWRAFRWDVHEIDGHDHTAIGAALAAERNAKTPRCIVAHTTKGKGVSFMEDKLEWHYKSPTEDQLRTALAELGDPE